jgi:hypothetical protein
MYTIFFYYKLCRAVDIFQNLCWPVTIWAVNIFLSKSETARNTRMADDFWFSTSWQKSDICSNGVEQMKNCVDQFFQANKFWAVDHDSNKIRWCLQEILILKYPISKFLFQRMLSIKEVLFCAIK